MKLVGNSDFQRAANTSLILNYLRMARYASRMEIARELGLQPSTVTYIVNRLISGGIVRVCCDSHELPVRSGRKPVFLELVPEYGVVTGMDLQADYYHAVAVDITGQPVMERRQELSVGDSSIEKRLLSAYSDFFNAMDKSLPLLGMGIAIPGIVNSEERIVEDCWTHRLSHHSMDSFLDENFSFPVLIENDANCCAQYIQWFERESRQDSCLYLLSKFHKRQYLPESVPAVGIGLGLILHGSLYTGASYKAGEYQSILFNGKDMAYRQFSLDNDEIAQASGNLEIRRKIVSELLGNVLFLMKILNPDALYIGGEIGTYKELILEILENEHKARWEPLKQYGCQIEPLSESDSHPALGAAACMLKNIYTVPQVGTGVPNQRIWKSLLANIYSESEINKSTNKYKE